MDEAKRKSYDEHYDWWSAEEAHKLICITCPSRRDIAIANQWHEYFLWKPIAEKVHPIPIFGSLPAERAREFGSLAFYKVFFKRLSAPYAGWGRDIDRFSEKSIYEDSVQYTIIYERAVDSPHLNEIGKLQNVCEELVREMGTYSSRLDEANEKLTSILPFGKAEARQKKEEAERMIPQLHEQIDSTLARVNELRTIILGR